MGLIELLADQEWDEPFFKQLASNDTGSAPGHQGGIVIPKDLRCYFPSLNPDDVSAITPTTDRRVLAELWDGAKFLGLADTRYQFQTWGGTRSPESRLTDNLAPLRNLAVGGDVLVIQRHATDLALYRLFLVRQTSAQEFQRIAERIDNERWGVLGELPVTDEVLIDAVHEMESRQDSPFELFETSPQITETRRRQLARTTAFRRSISELYAQTCSVCETALRTVQGLSELEAAHIVPRQRGGVNDARNGLGLCRRHHWAFDKGLFGINQERRIYVPGQVKSISFNDPLAALDGKVIMEASQSTLRAHGEAFQWHLDNVVNRSE